MRAVTVTGEIEARDLGVVLPHEHICDDARFLCAAPDASQPSVDEIPREALQAEPMRWRDNLYLDGGAAEIQELMAFKRAGGATVVELTSIGLSRNPEALRQVALHTGVRIIMGGGYYVARAHPPELERLSARQLADLLVRELREGVGDTGIRPGVIGELGTSAVLQPAEVKVLRAAALAHLETGCPINVHFAAGAREVFKVLDIFAAEGVRDCSRLVMSHLDAVLDLDQHCRVAERGAVVEYDGFGGEGYPDSHGNVLPTDAQRVAAVRTLIERGHGDRLLLSHDIAIKSNLRRYGGQGYAHLLERVAPLLERAGVGEADRRRLMVENPARIFAYLPAEAAVTSREPALADPQAEDC